MNSKILTRLVSGTIPTLFSHKKDVCVLMAVAGFFVCLYCNCNSASSWKKETHHARHVNDH
ncbi:MAG: hypothetical protein HUU08_09150 [Candidatus Brocadia sp.]|nr:hypothetical protein [Candidatus Brocadia sp.]